MPGLNLIEHPPQRVVAAFRRGEFDPLEIIGQADEKELLDWLKAPKRAREPGGRIGFAISAVMSAAMGGGGVCARGKV